MSELNPNHPMLQEMQDKWQVLVAFLVYKYGGGIEGEITLDLEDFVDMPAKFGMAITTTEKQIFLKLVSSEEALYMAREEGGLPN